MMASHILQFVNSSKTQKSKYLENKAKALFFLQIKIHSCYNKGCTMAKNNFLVEMTLMEIMVKYFTTQLTFTCSKSTIETLEKSVKYVQS